MRRLVDASRVRIPVPVRSRPRWSRRIPTRIAHGIGHDYAWVFMDSIGNKAVNPKLAESAPNANLDRIGARGVASEEDTVYLCASRTSPAAFPNPLGLSLLRSRRAGR